MPYRSSQHAGAAQRADLVGPESPPFEDSVVKSSDGRWRVLDLRHSAAESGRRRGLGDTIHFDECASGAIVRMLGRLIEVEHRRETSVGPLEQAAPFVTRARRDERGDA